MPCNNTNSNIYTVLIECSIEIYLNPSLKGSLSSHFTLLALTTYIHHHVIFLRIMSRTIHVLYIFFSIWYIYFKNIWCGTYTISQCIILVLQPIKIRHVSSIGVNTLISCIKIANNDTVYVLVPHQRPKEARHKEGPMPHKVKSPHWRWPKPTLDKGRPQVNLFKYTPDL